MKKSSVIVAILMLVILAACSKGSDLIYFTSDRDGNMEIYSIDPDSGEELNITDNPEDEYSPVISPNREWLAFLVGNENRSSVDVLNLDNRERFTMVHNREIFTPVHNREGFTPIHLLSIIEKYLLRSIIEKDLLRSISGKDLLRSRSGKYL